jgi:hypothetical protein
MNLVRSARALFRRYGRAATSGHGLTSHDLGNNESAATGVSYNEGHSEPWLALTRSQSKWFKTLAGATRWLEKRGYDAHGRRIK